MLEAGDLIHVITRRTFEGDVRRHFVGEVVDADGRCARVHGYAFVLDPTRNEFVRKRQPRTRILGIADSGNVIVVLPHGVDLESLRYDSSNRKMLLTDGHSFSMDVNEFGAA